MVDLQKSLALIAARLNEEARKAMFDLLSGELRGRVEDLARHADPMGEELALYQQRLVVGFEPPVQVEDKNVVGETVEDASLAGFIAEDARDESDPLADLPKPNAISPNDAGLVAVLGMLCAAGPKHVAADLLVHLPLHLQGPLIVKMLKTSPLSATSALDAELREVVEVLREAMPNREEWGIEPVCQMLRSLDSTRQVRRLLTTADETDHESVVVLQNHLFNFEDLLRLSRRDQQALLVQVDNQMLGQALLRTEERVHRGLLANVSVRRQSLIGEEEERWAESTSQEVEIAQQGMLALARHLYEQSKITTYLGSVSRKGLKEFQFEEDIEDKEAEGEGGEVEAEEHINIRRLLIGGLVLLVASLVVWGVVSWVAMGGGQNTGAGKRVASRAGIIARPTKGVGVVGDVSLGKDFSGRAGKSVPTQAVVEVAGLARVKALQATELEEREEDEGGLTMRVGKMRTMVLDEDFVMRTPIVLIKGVLRGTVFDTRVVLDAGTTVEVVRGAVEVQSLLHDGKMWRIDRGSLGVFDTQGNGRIEKIK
ncbi:MAG: hypothetical protein HOL51_05170 [Gemmatimonadetes bacterium]|nr:hypothetical protein [Gemmatimonadota bacterium]MBT5450323.1 hypothetical protein [Gemmatimonadota bacterium]MBT6905399.1 hypothetical protein [Gemmatimonadota bacterium]MBT7420757.1 hypothetical protein [Gemmatimonadota bacterium]MBT7548687.1 hypothetical protein [Gemmatimonadota bacterium]